MPQDDTIVEINELAFIDQSSHTIVMQVDRVGITFYVEEFLDFFKNVEEIKDFLFSNPHYIVGRLMGEAEEKEIIVPKPEDDEYT